MESPFVIPLAIFAMVVLIVALAKIVKLRGKELEVHQTLHTAQLEHERKMRELDIELERVKGGG